MADRIVQNLSDEIERCKNDILVVNGEIADARSTIRECRRRLGLTAFFIGPEYDPARLTEEDRRHYQRTMEATQRTLREKEDQKRRLERTKMINERDLMVAQYPDQFRMCQPR
ncbi:hypothetical protein LTR66_004809 [Elasticomyces elasticus]|nr:hypothetical protein LTR66_004809 [Elasticomyces elasticus]KAK5006097.1 hypothetical protein LTR28_006907 [Elasticomyces elasticus]